MSRDLGIPLMVQRSTLTMLVALTLIGCEGANPNTSSAQARTLPPAPAKPVGPVPAQTVDASRRTAITTAAERVAPAVVTVQTETVQKVPVDFFEYFMGGRTGERHGRQFADRLQSRLRVGDRLHRAAMVLPIGHIVTFAAPRI